MSSCRSCGAPIIWATQAHGRPMMPMDAAPVPDGTWRLVRAGAVVHAVAVGRTVDLLDETDDGIRHVSHFATCPNAAEHRRKR